MNKSNTMVWITFQKVGIHLYPAAATDPSLVNQSYLAHPHRHLFKFKVWIEVFHEDRDIEFIKFKEWIESLYSSGNLELNSRSCEMISDELAAKIHETYPNRRIVIEVSEDGENGSFTEYPVE